MPITLHTEEAVEIPEQTELAIGRERDEFQQATDKDVEALKLATAKARWPKHDPAKLFHRYVVGSDDKGAMKSVIRRAATLHHLEAVFYKEARTEAGHVVIKFHVARKLDKDGKPVKDESLKADGSPKE
jgi:phosphoribosylpyrophosphate synthetase